MSSSAQPILPALLFEQQELEMKVHHLHASPQETLAVGQDLLAFAAHEDDAFSALAPLLDPVVQAELAAEHQQIAEDLELLAWLLRTTGMSQDVAVLNASLVRRIRQHVCRDGRLLSRAAALLNCRR